MKNERCITVFLVFKEVGFSICVLGFPAELRGNPVSCVGIVYPGVFIGGDENGVCVIKPDEAESVMERALKKRTLQAAAIRHMERTGQPPH